MYYVQTMNYFILPSKLKFPGPVMLSHDSYFISTPLISQNSGSKLTEEHKVYLEQLFKLRIPSPNHPCEWCPDICNLKYFPK